MDTTGKDIDIRVNGITMCYDDLGKGDIPIIFIHGFPFDKSSWEPQMDFLKKTNRVIAYDIRGFGKSKANDEKANIALFADDLILFMDALQISRAVVCGLSMGGYILLNAVNRYANRFEAVVLSDTQCNADSDEAKNKRYKTIHEIEANGINDFASSFVKNAFCKESLTNKTELVEKIKNVILSTAPETITGTLKALAERWETCSSSEEIKVPTVIICGKEDMLTPLKQSEFLHNNIPGSILHSIDKAGHLSNLEQPDEFNKYLYSFVFNQVKKAVG
jgi:3-oxoadipate enol-lactonase